MGLSIDRLEQVPAVIAERQPLEHAAGEPVLELGKHRCAVGPRAPLALRELVGLIASLATEQGGQPLGVLGDEVHDEHLGVRRDPVGAVLDGQADQEARRADRALYPGLRAVIAGMPPPWPTLLDVN
jgi:hypothetical protein